MARRIKFGGIVAVIGASGCGAVQSLPQMESEAPQASEASQPAPQPSAIVPSAGAALDLLAHAIRTQGVERVWGTPWVGGCPPLVLGDTAIVSGVDVTDEEHRFQLQARSLADGAVLWTSDSEARVCPSGANEHVARVEADDEPGNTVLVSRAYDANPTCEWHFGRVHQMTMRDEVIVIGWQDRREHQVAVFSVGQCERLWVQATEAGTAFSVVDEGLLVSSSDVKFVELRDGSVRWTVPKQGLLYGRAFTAGPELAWMELRDTVPREVVLRRVELATGRLLEPRELGEPELLLQPVAVVAGAPFQLPPVLVRRRGVPPDGPLLVVDVRTGAERRIPLAGDVSMRTHLAYELTGDSLDHRPLFSWLLEGETRPTFPAFFSLLTPLDQAPVLTASGIVSNRGFFVPNHTVAVRARFDSTGLSVTAHRGQETLEQCCGFVGRFVFDVNDSSFVRGLDGTRPLDVESLHGRTLQAVWASFAISSESWAGVAVSEPFAYAEN